MFWTRPLAVCLVLEVVLVSAFSVVLEWEALPIIWIIVVSCQSSVSCTWRQRHRARVSGSRTAYGGLRCSSDVAPEVHRAGVFVSDRAEEHLAGGSGGGLSDAWIVEWLAG